jgi:hypothetical protein
LCLAYNEAVRIAGKEMEDNVDFNKGMITGNANVYMKNRKEPAL